MYELFLYISYDLIPTLSVDGFQERETDVSDTVTAFRFVGEVGAVLSGFAAKL